MTHDRDGWPEPRLINGIYRLEEPTETTFGTRSTTADYRVVPPQEPPYADLEQRVPDAWTDEPAGSFRRGFAWGCGAEIALGLIVLVVAHLLGYIK